MNPEPPGYAKLDMISADAEAWRRGDEALLLKKSDVAAMLGVSYRTVEKLVERSDLVQVKLGSHGSTLITRRSVIAVLREGYGKAGAFHGGTKNQTHP